MSKELSLLIKEEIQRGTRTNRCLIVILMANYREFYKATFLQGTAQNKCMEKNQRSKFSVILFFFLNWSLFFQTSFRTIHSVPRDIAFHTIFSLFVNTLLTWYTVSVLQTCPVTISARTEPRRKLSKSYSQSIRYYYDVITVEPVSVSSLKFHQYFL